MTPSSDTEVLIAGAGPTGLVLAVWLARLGIRIRIVDKNAYPAAHSRALAVQARTLEFYAQLGFAQELVDYGHKVGALNLWVAGKRRAHAPFGDFGRGLSPFPFPLIYPQDEHEPLLIRHLAELGVEVERPTELLGFSDESDHIVARLKLPDGSEQSCRAQFLAGCDGARSVVRQALHIGFPGGEYTHLFYVADVSAAGPVANGELHVALDEADFLAVFPLDDKGRVRLVGTIRDEQAEAKRDELCWDDVSKRVIEWLHVDVQQVNWFSTYRVHHRVAEHFRHNSVFLLGDAAHIHSPVGGQGMNTGIGDAVNLGWKLAGVLRGRAARSILDSYEPERIAFARRLVATTDQAFTAVTSDGDLARVVRLRIVPYLIPTLLSQEFTRRYLFRSVSQIGIDYRHSELSEGRTGKLHAGDRLPWLQFAGDSKNPHTDNFAALRSLEWQVHVYSNWTCPDIRRLCLQRGLEFHVFRWRPEFAAEGVAETAVYLIRPDGYIAFADPAAKARTLAAYLDAQGLSFR
ncbi:MAG TPA: FAD-dependent monooxygenase [Candidatus Aquilonibacter sp.]|nr:FAD-dependent monooxygenase [Candidatus Aquilonibacter sp.]